MDEQAEREPDRTCKVTGCGSGCGLLAAGLAAGPVGQRHADTGAQEAWQRRVG
jgi:hypothetical protein